MPPTPAPRGGGANRKGLTPGTGPTFLSEREAYARPAACRAVDEALRRYFEGRPDVRLAYLFGSRARGDAAAGSDVDVAVLFDRPPETLLDLGQLSVQLGAALGLDPDDVDVAELNGSALLFQYQVLRDGRCVYARSEAARTEYEAQTLCLYYDFLPVIEEYNRHQREWLRRATA